MVAPQAGGSNTLGVDVEVFKLLGLFSQLLSKGSGGGAGMVDNRYLGFGEGIFVKQLLGGAGGGGRAGFCCKHLSAETGKRY